MANPTVAVKQLNRVVSSCLNFFLSNFAEISWNQGLRTGRNSYSLHAIKLGHQLLAMFYIKLGPHLDQKQLPWNKNC